MVSRWVHSSPSRCARSGLSLSLSPCGARRRRYPRVVLAVPVRVGARCLPARRQSRHTQSHTRRRVTTHQRRPAGAPLAIQTSSAWAHVGAGGRARAPGDRWSELRLKPGARHIRELCPLAGQWPPGWAREPTHSLTHTHTSDRFVSVLG